MDMCVCVCVCECGYTDTWIENNLGRILGASKSLTVDNPLLLRSVENDNVVTTCTLAPRLFLFLFEPQPVLLPM